MDNFNVYSDIKARTNGEIYVGIVGPVRTGKSTFIKRFMELMVLPGMDDPHARERTRDELPQSSAGKTIMTTEPKFIPKGRPRSRSATALTSRSGSLTVSVSWWKALPAILKMIRNAL